LPNTNILSKESNKVGNKKLQRTMNMKKEYDFSKGVRGKFYRPGLRINLPIYLNDENRVFIEGIAKKKKSDMAAVVNQLIKSDKELAKAL
jgi:hypothetical protein